MALPLWLQRTLSSSQPLTTMSAPFLGQLTNISTPTNGAQEEDQTSQRVKRQRTCLDETRCDGSEVAAGVGKLAGRLPSIIALPANIFCEIACRLIPWDLLNMAWSSKLLRNMLMSKNSKQIWRAAEDAVGLPKCPSDLSSPQYANLCYGTSCTQCGTMEESCRWISVMHRLCITCTSKEIGSEEEISHFTEAIETEASLPDILDFSSHFSHSNYSVKTAVVMYEKWLSLDPENREDFLRERMYSLYEVDMFSLELEQWFDSKNTAKMLRIRKAQENFKSNIFKRLRALGYVDEDLFPGNNFDERGWKWNSLLMQSRELTEEEWSYIHPQLEVTIGLRQEKRRRIKHKNALIEFSGEVLNSDEGKDCCATVAAFFALPDVAALLDSDDEEISLAQREAARVAFIELIKESRQRVEDECAAMLFDVQRDEGIGLGSRNTGSVSRRQAGCKGHTTGTSALVHHATAFWGNPDHTCMFVGFTHTIDGVVRALHTRAKRTFADPDANPQAFLVLEEYRPTPMTVRIAHALFAALPFPPATTMADMEALGEKFTCRRCAKKRAQKWTELILQVEHFHEETVIHEVCSPTRPDPHDLTAPGPLTAYDVTA
ncbi:hypothetical protein DFH11DRAFT_1259089 [Phellopilus nigrolimitatus]|nr:hypothetical protein DFH11DRAFT_1259089 [Phellopilus nigrolimitatus]